jgi:lauroyl/myristoyl acyltransferase
MIELIRLFDEKVAFMAIHPRDMLDGMYNPVHNSGMQLLKKWDKSMKIIYVPDGNAIQRARDALADGMNVVMAVDVPGYVGRGVRVRMFDRVFEVPAGAVRLSHDMKVPLVYAFPWTVSPAAPYRISLNNISTVIPEDDMQQVFTALENIVDNTPFCWKGWHYLHAMEVR